MFGVYEAEYNSYWQCLQSVLTVFRETVPSVAWNERDIVRVQRRDNRSRPRPVVVEMATLHDKINLLQNRRNPTQGKGIRITSELTSRQPKILSDLRDQGHEAYFRNSKL